METTFKCLMTLLPFLLLCCCCWASFDYTWLGAVTPDDPRPVVGDNLTLICNMTEERKRNSSFFRFTLDGYRIPCKYTDIISPTAIRLRYPITKPGSGSFGCYLTRKFPCGRNNKMRRNRRVNRTRDPKEEREGDRQEEGRINREGTWKTLRCKRRCRIIGYQFARAEYWPLTITAINCTVNNWDKMTCVWDLGQHYYDLNNVHVDLYWTISGKWQKCPNMTNKTSCTWPSDASSISDIFLFGVYTMRIEVNVGQVSATSNFSIETQKLVKPDRVKNLTVSNYTATCLDLTWWHSESTRTMLARVEYFSEWDKERLVTLPLKKFKETALVRLCGLTPFTNYTIRVGVRPEQDGFLSDWIQTVEQTTAAVPEVGPAVCAGCFKDLPSKDEQRKVIIYWQHIPKPLRYSLLRGYHVELDNNDNSDNSSNPAMDNCNFTDLHTTSCLLTLQSDRSYTLHVYAVTSQNQLSRNFSTITIPSLGEKPSLPRSFVVETERKWSKKFTLHWAGQEDRTTSTSSYLVIWCRGSRTNEMCDDKPSWKELPADNTSYILDVKYDSNKGDNQEDFLVGVSRQVTNGVNITSSGIVWAKCIYLYGEVPGPPTNVKFADVQKAGSLLVLWDRADCSINNVKILEYRVYYCQTVRTANCTGAESVANVSSDSKSVLLKNLIPGANYSVAVSAVSRWGEGQKSQPPITTTVASVTPDSANITSMVVVILAVIIVVIITILILARCRSHCKKVEEKFDSIEKQQKLPQRKPRVTLRDSPFNIKHRPLPCVPQSVSNTTSGFVSGHADINGNKELDGKQEAQQHWRSTFTAATSGDEETPLLLNDDHRSDGSASSAEPSDPSCVSARPTCVGSGRDVAKQAKDDVTAPLGNVNGYLSQEQSAAMAQSEKEAGKKSEDAARQKEVCGPGLHEQSVYWQASLVPGRAVHGPQTAVLNTVNQFLQHAAGGKEVVSLPQLQSHVAGDSHLTEHKSPLAKPSLVAPNHTTQKQMTSLPAAGSLGTTRPASPASHASATSFSVPVATETKLESGYVTDPRMAQAKVSVDSNLPPPKLRPSAMKLGYTQTLAVSPSSVVQPHTSSRAAFDSSLPKSSARSSPTSPTGRPMQPETGAGYVTDMNSLSSASAATLQTNSCIALPSHPPVSSVQPSFLPVVEQRHCTMRQGYTADTRTQSGSLSPSSLSSPAGKLQHVHLGYVTEKQLTSLPGADSQSSCDASLVSDPPVTSFSLPVAKEQRSQVETGYVTENQMRSLGCGAVAESVASTALSLASHSPPSVRSLTQPASTLQQSQTESGHRNTRSLSAANQQSKTCASLASNLPQSLGVAGPEVHSQHPQTDCEETVIRVVPSKPACTMVRGYTSHAALPT